MNVTKKLCLKLCRQILNSSGLQAEDFITKSYEEGIEEVKIVVSDAEDDVAFQFKKQKPNVCLNVSLFYVKSESSIMCLENVTIKGYYTPKSSELNLNQLVPLFEELAVNHASLIAKNYKSQTKEGFRDVPKFELIQEVLDSIFKLARSIGVKEIDLKIFEEGVFKLMGEDIFQPNNSCYINGSIFQKKIFFRKDNSSSTHCKILNIQKGQLVPAFYDMLSLLYMKTDQKQRQRYFHELINHYYIILKDTLNELKVETDEKVSFEREVKMFIPNVKLRLLCHRVNQFHEEIEKGKQKSIVDFIKLNNDYKKFSIELVTEIYEHILYPQLSREDCYKIVEDTFGARYEKLEYKLIKLEGVPGLLGEYHKLKINVEDKDGEKVLQLFVKFLPNIIGNVVNVAEREEFFYTIFISELKKVGLEGITDFLPKCYFMRQTDVIVLEDLSHTNYRSIRSDESTSFEMLELAVKQLAKMHACSLLYEEINGKASGEESRIDLKYNKYVQEFVYIKDGGFREMENNCAINSVANYLLDKFSDVSKDLPLETFRERVRLLFDVMYTKIRKSDKYRNVICHGDIWGGNILFKFDGPLPTECCFVDYQLIRYCPPAHDLLTFLYVNSDRSTRTEYMFQLVDAYYNELSAVFKRYDFDLNKIYPYSHFKECCEYMKSQAVCLATLMYPNALDRVKIQDLLQDSEKKKNFFLVDQKEVLEELLKDDRIRARLREIIEDLYELCLNIDANILI